MGDNTSNISLTTTIDGSPLSPEDKSHWVGLLPKLTTEQKEKLHHALVAKTQIVQTISLIENALKIIEEAEAEAEKEYEDDNPLPPPAPAQAQGQSPMPVQLPSTPQSPQEDMAELHQDIQSGDIPAEDLKDLHKESQEKLQGLRDELKKLSVDVHGAPPPSYNQQ